MPARKGLLAPQNTFLDTIATRFDGTHSNFVLGNAKITKIYPIVYCSDGFCDLSGYSRAQIMQKSCACNFLYGQKTDSQHRESISRALEQKKELKLEVILYKSSGTPFWCLLDIVPIQDEKHEVVLFLCSHKDITKQKLHEQQQHQLAQLHAQKQQQLLSNAAAAAAAASASGSASDPHSPAGLSEHQSDHNSSSNSNNNNHQQQQQQQVADLTSDSLKAGRRRNTGIAEFADAWKPTAQQTDQQQQEQLQRKLEDADEAELTAMANQNALLSMDEFGLQDDSGCEGPDFEEGASDSGDDHDKHTTSQYSRRRSRAVLYQLSGHYGYRRSVNMKSKLKLNNRMNIPEYKTTTIEKQRFILSHYGVGKSCWDWLILVVSFYVAIVVPYNATFKDKQEDLMGGECKIDSIDILVELVFLIDVLLNFRTTFVNRKGEVVTRPEIICKHYVRGWFVVDACAALPFDLLCSLNLYSRKMDRYSQYSYIILTLLMLIFSLLAHWCACIWYVIAMEEIAQNPSDWKIGWLHQLSDKLGRNVVNATDMAASYVTALYFTTSSLTSVGFGNVSANTNAEKIFSIVIMLIGALMHAVVFGNVTALIRVMYARRSNYQTRLRDLKDFFRLHQLPKELQQRMSDYFQTTWSLNHGIETYEILKDFPEELRGDVSLHLHREVLSLPIFETAPQGFLKSLARHIESKFCCPTEYLIHRGDALNYLYLVCNGSMEVLQDNMVVAILGKGDLVGYDVNAMNLTPEQTQFGISQTGGPIKSTQSGAATLMTSTSCKLVKSSSDLKALTYCDLKCIQIAGLLEVLKLYPEFSDTFQREIIHDLSFNLRENHDIDHEMMLGHDDDDLHEHDGDDADEDDEDEDDEDNDDDDGDDGDHDDAHGDKGNDEPPSGRSKMNLLFRSIEHQQRSHQIGRYDYAEDDEHDSAQHDEQGVLVTDEHGDQEEDEEEEEEDEEEEVEEEEQDDDDEMRADNNDNDENGDDNDRNPGVGGQAAAPSGDTNGRCSNGKRKSEQNGQQQQQQQESGTGGKNCSRENELAARPATTEVATNRLQDNLRRRRMRAVGDSLEGKNTGPSVVAVSWHSCEGLGAGSGSPKSAPPLVGGGGSSQQGGGGGARTMMMMSKRNNSDEFAAGYRNIYNNNGHRHQSAMKSGARQQSAVATVASGATDGQSAGTLRDRKPPIMFDLSRNTTVIVDRRRRSAGCIMAPRPLLIGPAARQANHSSLTHISENPGYNKGSHHHQATQPDLAAATRRRPRRNHYQRSLDSGSNITQRSDKIKGNSSSSQDQLNTRLNCLSFSVRELKQELQQELSQMRGTMQLFMQMAEQQQQQQQPRQKPLSPQSSGSLGQIGHAGNGRRNMSAATRGQRVLSDNPAASSIIGVHRSQSASSLPSATNLNNSINGTSSNNNANANSMFRLIAANREAGILHEESDVDLSGCDERQSIASEPAVLPVVTTSMSLDGSNQKGASSSCGLPLAEAGSGRARSQCASPPPMPLPAPPPLPPPLASTSAMAQPQPYMNCLQTTTSYQCSDNDSGRSSTSMNSSSQTNMINQVGGAKLAATVLYTGNGSQRQVSGAGKQYATTTTIIDGADLPSSATSTKSSLV